MGKLITRFLTWAHQVAAYEPATISWALNGGIAIVAASAFHLTSTEEAAVAVVVTALVTVYTAVRARPANVPVVIGALATITGAFAAFGWHPSAHTIAAATGLVSAVLPLLFRQALTPVARIKAQQAAAAVTMNGTAGTMIR